MNKIQGQAPSSKKIGIGKLGWILVVAMTVMLLLTGCGANDKPAAAAINPEADVCAHCNMAVPDNEHATQMILADGTVLKFDDIGCLIKHQDENELDIAVSYVRDANTKEWIELEQATFLYDETIQTPMGYGILSFKDKAAAEAKQKEYPNGVIMGIADLKNHHWKRNMEHMKMNGHGMSKHQDAGHQQAHPDSMEQGKHEDDGMESQEPKH